MRADGDDGRGPTMGAVVLLLPYPNGDVHDHSGHSRRLMRMGMFTALAIAIHKQAATICPHEERWLGQGEAAADNGCLLQVLAGQAKGIASFL